MVLSIDSMLGRRWAAITTSMGHGVTRCGLELRLVKVGGVGFGIPAYPSLGTGAVNTSSKIWTS